jgi:hypothetical protein
MFWAEVDDFNSACSISMEQTTMGFAFHDGLAAVRKKQQSFQEKTQNKH